MKKLIFKKWVEYVLIIILLFCIMFISAECISFKAFIISKIICILVIIVIGLLLKKYGRD